MESSGPHFLSGKKIIVAGGGLAGLAFASALGKLWPGTAAAKAGQAAPTVRVYERDTEEGAAGRGGYSISVAGHDETGGLAVLRRLGLVDEALAHAVLGLDATGRFKLWDRGFGDILSVRFKPHADLPTPGIRIARRNLRKVLLDDVATAAHDDDDDDDDHQKEEGIVTWDAACTAARRLENGQMVVTIVRGRAGDDGERSTTEAEETCDLLVCADGANSRLRKSLRPHDALRYAGAVQMGGQATFDGDGSGSGGSIPRPLGDSWGLVITGTGATCFCSPVDDSHVVWAVSRLEPERAALPPAASDDERRAVLAEARQIGWDIGPPFEALVDATPLGEVFAFPARDKEPFAHDVEKGGHVVFLGDANHAVSPFAGYGASLAMKDGWDLAEQLCGGASLKGAVKAYDAISVPQARKILKSSHTRISLGHCTGIRYYLYRCMFTFARFMLWVTGQS